MHTQMQLLVHMLIIISDTIRKDSSIAFNTQVTIINGLKPSIVPKLFFNVSILYKNNFVIHVIFVICNRV